MVGSKNFEKRNSGEQRRKSKTFVEQHGKVVKRRSKNTRGNSISNENKFLKYKELIRNKKMKKERDLEKDFQKEVQEHGFTIENTFSERKRTLSFIENTLKFYLLKKLFRW